MSAVYFEGAPEEASAPSQLREYPVLVFQLWLWTVQSAGQSAVARTKRYIVLGRERVRRALSRLDMLDDWRPDFSENSVSTEGTLDLWSHRQLVSRESGAAVDAFIE